VFSTLDYVFVSSQWTIIEAKVVPRPLVDAANAEEGYASSRGVGIDAEVYGSQPSAHWPSDHFMILAKLQIS
jgi:hypothetical protein